MQACIIVRPDLYLNICLIDQQKIVQLYMVRANFDFYNENQDY